MMDKIPTQPGQFDGFWSSRVWSSRKMLSVTAKNYITLGVALEQAAKIFEAHEQTSTSYHLSLSNDDEKELSETLQRAHDECKLLSLPVSCKLLEKKMASLPRNSDELTLLIQAIYAEIETLSFLFIPPDRVAYYDNARLGSEASEKFSKSAVELQLAGSAYALEQPTSAVFHAMRAAEICVRLLAKTLKVRFATPIELQEWQPILNAINGKLRDIENRPKSRKRSDDLEFYGMAAAQLRFFKDGWRIKASHAGDLFSDGQARDAIDHVHALIETLARRLREPAS